jgi:hypothetical protein
VSIPHFCIEWDPTKSRVPRCEHTPGEQDDDKKREQQKLRDDKNDKERKRVLAGWRGKTVYISHVAQGRGYDVSTV